MSSLRPSGNDIEATMAAADSAASPRRDPTPLVRGTSVGRYVVIDRIGRGGMGIVYAAYDPELDRRVAVKLLAPEREGHSDGNADRIRLLREAQAMAKLANAHVVAVHDAGTHEGSVFIAMEFVEGGTLGATMAARPPWRTLLPWFLQAGSGLAAAHAVGLVHRDFKPDNVLLTKDGVAKVSDFGLARATTAFETVPDPSLRPAEDVMSGEITRVGAVIGTPAYMAPEQHLHLPTDARSDQFAFCVALYEALYGQRPFRARSLGELAYAVTQGDIADPPAGTSVPARLRRVVLRGLAVDPNARWPSMEALLAELRLEPSRQRTRTFVLGGLGLVVVGVAGTLAMLDRHERERCHRDAAAAQQRWNDDTRATMVEAMQATDLAFAETSIDRTTAILDAWVANWTATRDAVCIAAVRDPDDDALPLRSACLDERLVHLDVTLELLAEPDASTTTSAVQVAAGLPRLAPCEDDRWLRERAEWITSSGMDPADALEVARLVALTRAHRPDEARATAQALLVTTKDVPYLQAEVLLAIGMLEEDALDPSGAVKRFEQAYFLAGEHHNDRVAALAAINLTLLVGVHKGDLDQGRRWAAHATMMVQRDPDPELRHELLYVVGALETIAENHEVAIAAFVEEAALARQLYGEGHPEVGYAHLALGNTYMRMGRHADARAEYELAYELWADTFGPEHPATLMVTFNLGNLATEDGRFDDGLRLHREVLAIRERVRDPGHMDLAESYSAIGNLLVVLGDAAGALAQHRRSLEMHQIHRGPDAPRTWVEADAVVDDLLVLERLDEAEKLLAARCEAATRERETNADGWVRCLARRGDLQLASGHARAAAETLEQAVIAAEPLYGPTNLHTRTTRQRWARALLQAGEPERARAQLERIVAEWEASGNARHPDFREAVGLHGRAALELEELATAERSFARALALAQTHGAGTTEIDRRRRELADVRTP